MHRSIPEDLPLLQKAKNMVFQYSFFANLKMTSNSLQYEYQKTIIKFEFINLKSPQIMNFSAFFSHQLLQNQHLNSVTSGYYLYESSLYSLYFYHFIPLDFDKYLPPQNISNQFSQALLNNNPQHKPDKTLQQEYFISQIQSLRVDKPASSVIIKYGKKNAESNVINQVFSFLSIRSKSSKTLSKLLKNDKDLQNLYYQFMIQIKKKNKKYINRKYLRQLIDLQNNHHAVQILKKLDPENFLGVTRLKRVIRTLISYYFRCCCACTVLTSAKLDKEVKNEHLQRNREIQQYLNYYMRNTIHTE